MHNNSKLDDCNDTVCQSISRLLFDLYFSIRILRETKQAALLESCFEVNVIFFFLVISLRMTEPEQKNKLRKC